MLFSESHFSVWELLKKYALLQLTSPKKHLFFCCIIITALQVLKEEKKEQQERRREGEWACQEYDTSTFLFSCLERGNGKTTGK